MIGTCFVVRTGYKTLFKRRRYAGIKRAQDPGTLPTTIFSDSGGESEFSYHDQLATSPGATATEGDAFFDKG